MDKTALRDHVFEILRKTPQTHFHAIENDLRRLTDDYERHDVLTLQEILWELLVQGVLAPGKNSLNLNLPFVHLTEYGTRCLEDGSALVHDPQGYVAELLAKTDGRAGEFVQHSVREALTVFLSGSWPSSILHLARAAEVLFDLLAQALVHSGLREGRGTKRLENAHRFSIHQAQLALQATAHRPLPQDLLERVEPQLNGLLALMQGARDSDGSPRQPRPSKDQALAYFLLFPEQCAFVYHLIDTLET